jgi:hypothetical protein
MSTAAGKFVQEAYDDENDWSIEHFSQVLKMRGYELVDKPKEDYRVDITAIKDGKESYYEVEVKKNYPFTTEEDFKFPTVSFLARKKKWADVGFWYVIICKETLSMLMCHSDEIFKDEYRVHKNINTSHRKGSDIMYHVPKDKCKFITWNDLTEGR